MKTHNRFTKLFLPIASLFLLFAGCSQPAEHEASNNRSQRKTTGTAIPEPQFTLTKDQTHNKFSSTIPPVIHVPSGAIIEVYTEEASDGQVTRETKVDDLADLDFDLIHPLTGPVYVESAEPGDILAVTLHSIEVIDYGWNSIIPGFGFLAEEFSEPYLKLFCFNKGDSLAIFSENIKIPIRAFPGVMGVAPADKEMLTTIPPRANGGNMDDPFMTEGTTVYFPVFVKGALFSIGDIHAAQGMGEVCGTAIESPSRIIYEVNVIKNKKIAEPEYETKDYYAVTAFGETLDDAARKAVRYMVNYLVNEHDLKPTEAYALCSMAGDLHIAEVVDVPHMLVSMHISKEIFSN